MIDLRVIVIIPKGDDMCRFATINLRVLPTRKGGAGDRNRTYDLLFTKQQFFLSLACKSRKLIFVNPVFL